MSDLLPTEVVILSDLPQNGGTPLSHVSARIETRINRRRDGKHACSLVVARTDEEGNPVPWVSDIACGQAAYTRTPLGQEWDWRIEEVQDSPDVPVLVACDPPEIDLINAGPWFELVGGVASYRFSFRGDGTALLGLVESFMAAQGFGYLDVGTVDSAVNVSLDLEGTCLQIIDAFVEGVRAAGGNAHFVLRRTASAYEMHVVEDPSFGASEILISEGLNLKGIERHRGRNLVTVATVRGTDVDGFRTPMGAGFWRITGTPVYEELEP